MVIHIVSLDLNIFMEKSIYSVLSTTSQIKGNDTNLLFSPKLSNSNHIKLDE